MRHAELTGLKRLLSVRTLGGRERLVLQLQERGLHTSYIGGHCDTQWVTRWRDATSADLTLTNVSVGDMLAVSHPDAGAMRAEGEPAPASTTQALTRCESRNLIRQRLVTDGPEG